MINILSLVFSALIADNIVFSYGIGSENTDESSSSGVVPAIKYGVLLILTAAVATALKWVAQVYVIERFALEYLKVPLYVLSVVVSALAIRFLAGRVLPKIYGNLKMADSLVTDVALVGIIFVFNPVWGGILTSVLAAVVAAIGVMLASLIFVMIKEKLELSNVPRCMRGLPIMLVSAGIIALVFAELENVINYFYLH